MIYTPDSWVILKLHNMSEVHYRVVAGWHGGYTQGNSWKMNSGITKYTIKDKLISFDGYSGSCYNCYINSERMSGYMAMVYDSYAQQSTEKMWVEVIPFEQFKEEFQQ